MLVPVIKYQVDWNTRTNAYRVLVQYVPNTQPVALPINSEMEFVAALIMLGKPGVMIDNPTLVLDVPARSPGT
jgi:hypothetical protein